MYTVLYGGYETLLEQHIAAGGDIDLICFTDDPTLDSPTWDVRYLAPALPADPTRSGRRVKMLAHLVLPEYDESLYIDNTVLLTVDPAELFEKFLPEGTVMALPEHDFRDTVRDEFREVVLQGKEAAWVRDEQLDHYLRTDPEMLDLVPLWTGLMLRRHHDPAVIAAMTTWWQHVLRYSRRDQLSLRLALRSANLEPSILQLDNHVSPVHEWPRSTKRQPDRATPLPTGPEAVIGGLHQELLARQRELDAALALVAERDAQFVGLNTEIEVLRGHLERVAAAERAARTEGDRLTTAAAVSAALLSQLRDFLAARDAEVSRLTGEQALVVAERDANRVRVDQLLTTVSWRLTAPLRAACKALRRLRR